MKIATFFDDINFTHPKKYVILNDFLDEIFF